MCFVRSWNMGFEALCIAAWLMAQKQLEERMMSSEKEIMDLKEILPKLKKSANSKKEDIVSISN